MPVKKDENGRRSVEASVEVPGTPEEVWRAIATGPGISSWFVPSTVEERVGGTTVCSFGPGMDSVAKITKWDPPHGYTAETEEGPGNVATEWTVESRRGGMCVVRVVHRWFAETDDWDSQFEGHAYGWASSFFRMLRIYLTHFAGEKCSEVALAAFARAQPREVWTMVKGALTIDQGRAASVPGAPGIAGVVESTEITDPGLLAVRERSPQIVAAMAGMEGEEPQLLLRLEQPSPGIVHMFVMGMGDQTMVSIRFYLYGEQGARVAGDVERAWSDWLAKQFPQEATE